MGLRSINLVHEKSKFTADSVYGTVKGLMGELVQAAAWAVMCAEGMAWHWLGGQVARRGAVVRCGQWRRRSSDVPPTTARCARGRTHDGDVDDVDDDGRAALTVSKLMEETCTAGELQAQNPTG